MKTTEKEIEAAAEAIYNYYINSVCAPKFMYGIKWEVAIKYSQQNSAWVNVINTSRGEAKAALYAAYAVREEKQ